MQLQIEYFANSCEDLIFKYLPFLSDTHFQENEWFAKKHPQFSCVDFVEQLLRDLKHLFTTLEFKHYEHSEAMILLKKLYLQIMSYYTNIETASRFDNPSLLEDSGWIEIQNLSKITEEELKKFITYLRSNIES